MRYEVGEVTDRLEIELCSAHSPTLPSVHLRHRAFSNPSVSLRMSQLCSFSNLSVSSPTSQRIFQLFRHFTYVRALLILQLFRHFTYVRALLILQPFRHFTYVTAHSPTLTSLYVRHSSFSNPSVASPTSQLFLQPFFRFSYVTCSSLTSPGEPPMVFRIPLIESLNEPPTSSR